MPASSESRNFEKERARDAGATQLVGTLKAHRDLPVSGILHAMVKRLCQ
jgi:hypothetical protein